MVSSGFTTIVSQLTFLNTTHRGKIRIHYRNGFATVNERTSIFKNMTSCGPLQFRWYIKLHIYARNGLRVPLEPKRMPRDAGNGTMWEPIHNLRCVTPHASMVYAPAAFFSPHDGRSKHASAAVYYPPPWNDCWSINASAIFPGAKKWIGLP